jgi:hypothetical protein
MFENAKPAAGNGGRAIVISDWKAHEKNTLRGFFTATLPSGLELHNLTLHEKNGSRWIAFPARGWKDSEGKTQFARFITFRDRDTADRFRDTMLEALDRYLAAGGHHEAS